jgi:flagellar hook-associated protein 2
MSTSTSTSTIFTGSSRYSTDFQNVISRAVSIATLPVTQLQTTETGLTSQSTELSTLDTDFTTLQTAIEKISTAVGSAAYSATSSDEDVATATVTEGATPGTYSLTVSDIGAYATSMTSSSWSAGTEAATYKLTVGDTTYDISPSSDSAADVASAINSAAGSAVTATVVNVGGSSSTDYRLVLTATALGDLSPSLTKDGTEVQTQQTTGSLAKYEVANSGITVESDSRTVSIADGVSVDLVSASDTAIDITVSASYSKLSSALSSFATAYNAVATELASQRGSEGGALTGQSIVSTLSTALRSLGTYNDSDSGLSGLLSLGLTLGKDGQITFDSDTFDTALSSDSTAIATFLGSADSGGFLKQATDAMTGLLDTDTGSLTTAQSSLTTQISNIEDRITAAQARVDALETRLNAKMAAADALVATLEQTYSYITSLLDATDTDTTTYTS